MALNISLTNFPNGITSFGAITFGVGGLLPYGGNYYWVDATSGSDGNSGGAHDPFATLDKAYSVCTAENNDVVMFNGTQRRTSSLVWAKNKTHLIGLCAPMRRGKRARISVTGSTGFNKLLDVTASGCYFANFGTFFGWVDSSTSLLAVSDTGGRNCYDNVEFLGFGDATVSTGSSNLTGSRAFKLNTSTGETTFRGCVFGEDTSQRNATNYTVEIAGNAPRITFENCDFESFLGSSGTGAAHLLIGAAGIDRYLNMKNCRFMSSTKSTGSTMAQVMSVSGSAGGFVLLDQCTAFGATHWETSASGSVVLNMATVTARDGGIAVAASPS